MNAGIFILVVVSILACSGCDAERVSQAPQIPPPHAVPVAAEADIPTLIITAKRMTALEKRLYDQSTQITVARATADR